MRSVPSAVSTELNQDNIFLVTLFEIGGMPTLRYNDTNRPVVWNGVTWSARGSNYASNSETLGAETAEYNVTLDNYDQAITAWAVAQRPIGFISTVYVGLSNGTLDSSDRLTLIGNFAWIEFTGKNANFEIDKEFSLTIRTAWDMAKARGPGRDQYTQCRFRGANGFKGKNCGYTGSETSCNYTFDRCKELGNQRRFGGFPDLNDRVNS